MSEPLTRVRQFDGQRFEYTVHEYHLDFTAYDVNVWDTDDPGHLVAAGSLKWDGCANLSLGHDGLLFHTCHPGDGADFFRRLYSLGSSMANWDHGTEYDIEADDE